MSEPDKDRPVGLWVIAAIGLGIMVLAIWLAVTGPTLRYEAYGFPDQEVVVTCTGETTDTIGLTLTEDVGQRRYFEVDEGEKAVTAHVPAEYESGLGSEDYDPLALDRSINADCANAVGSRQWKVIWLLAALIPLSVAFVLIAVARRSGRGGNGPQAHPGGSRT